MANGGSIKYNIGFNVDKSGLNQLKSSLQEIKNMTAKDFMDINGGNDLTKAKNELEKIHQTLGKVDAAFESAFNSDLGTLNIAKFNQNLSNSGLTIQKIQADLARTGTAGQNAFRNMTSQILTTNMKLKESHTLIDNMATTMANTIKWGAASSVMNSFTGTVQRAYGYVKSLDSSLNDIRIVTGKSADEMDRFAEKANKAAKNLGQTTTNYTDAALIYYQQGLSDEEVQARAEVTLKAANVTGQSGAEVSEQLTAVWNGYKVTAEEAELYIDKLAAVAATTASDLEELSTGMSKVASAANLMGVDVDQLNAQLATIVSVTRQAPESVGTALKTIYARMGDIEAGLDSETTLGDYTEKMATMGINVLNMNGELRDMGEVMEEIGGKWTSMSREQQIYLSQVMAGTRQYNNLLSLFDNWDQYTKSLETSANAAGMLQKQQDTYMESTQAHLAQLKASWEDLYDSLLDADAINGVSDALSGVVSLMTNFVDSIGGGSGLLLALGAIGTKVFSKQIAGGLMTLINNLNVASDNMLQLKAEMQLTSDLGILPGPDSRIQQLVQMKKEFLELGQSVTNEERELSNELIKQTNELFKQEDLLNEKKENVQDIYNRFTGGNINVDDSTKVEQETAKASLKVQRDEFTRVSTDLGEMEKYVDLQKQIALSTEQLNELNIQIASVDEDRKKDLEEQKSLLEKQAEALEEQISSLAQQSAHLQDAEEAIAQMSRYKDAGMFSSEQSALLDETISKFNELTEGLDESTPKYRTAVKNLAQIFKQVLGGAISDIDVAINGLSEDFQQKAEQIKNSQAQVKAAFDELKNSVDLRNAIQGTIQMIGAMGQLASTINNIRQLGNIWSNEDLTAGEKILQTVQNLGFAIPMLVSAITTLKNSYRDVGKAMSGVLLSAKKYIFALGQQTGSTITNTIATSGGTAANLTFAQSFKVLFTSMGPVGWAIAALTAAVAILVPLVSKFIDAQNTASEVLERAEKNVSVLTDRYKELSTEVDNFKSKVSSYDEAINALKDLEKETDEYKQKLEEANKAAKELIETYGLFDDNDYKFENGLLTIDPQALADAQAEKITQEKQAEVNLNYAKIGENNALIDKKISDIVSKLPSIQEYGAEISPEYPQGGRYENTQYLNEEDIRAVASAYYEKYQENGNVNNPKLLGEALASIFPNYSGVSDFADSEWAQKYFFELGESMHSVADANKYYAKMATAGAIELQNASEIQAAALTEDKETGKEVLYAGREDALINAVTNKIAKGISLENYDTQSITSNNELNEKFGYQIGSDEDLFKEYARKFLAHTDAEISRMSYESGKLSLDGEEVLNNEEVSAEGARQALAQIAAAQQEFDKVSEKSIQESIDNLDLIAQRTDEIAKGAGTSITNAILNSMDYSGDGLDLSSAWETMSPWEHEALMEEANSHSPEELADLMGLGPEEFEAMGYENAKEFAAAFRKEMAEYDEEAFEQNEINAINRDAEAEGFKTEEVDAYAKTIKETAEASELLNDALKDNDIAAQQVAKQNMKLNRGVETLKSNWEEWSDIFKNSDEGSQKYSDALNGVKGALADIADTSEEYIDNDFVQDHLEEITRAAQGSEKDIDSLRLALSNEIVAKIAVDNELSPEKTAEFTNSWNALSSQLQDIEVGVVLSGEDSLIASLNEMILAAGMTTDQVNDLLGDMGFTATFAKEPQMVTTKIPQYKTTTSVQNVKPVEVVGSDGQVHVVGYQGETITRTEHMGDVPMTAEVGSFAMTTDGSIPKIETLTRSSSGATGNYSSSNRGKGGSGKGGGGGGKGGGGGSKAKDPNKKDPITEERDLYHDINYELEQINNELVKQERLTEKLTGKNRIEALNKELEILEKQADAEHRKLLLLQNERDTLKETLKGDGVLFDDEGDISNYNAALDAKLATLNEMINRYNAMSAEEQEKFESELETAQEAYEKFKEDMERYDELMTAEIFEAQERIDDILDQQIEKNIEQLEVEIELNIDTKEAERQLREFVKDFVKQIGEDDFANNAIFSQQQLNSYLGADGDLAVYEKAMRDAYEAYQKIQAGGTDDIYGNDAEKAKEAFENYRDEVYDIYGEMGDLIDEVYEAQLDGIDEANDKLDEQLEKYEYLYDIAERNLETSKLLQGEEDYETQLKYYNQMKAVNIERQRLLQDEILMWERKIEAEIEAGRENSEAVKAMQEHLTDAQEELADTTAESLELIAESYEIAKQKLTKDMNLAATGGKGLNYLAQEWELLNDNADMYLDAVNSAYETSQLESKVLDAIDNTDSVYAQEKLNKLMDAELSKLREKEKITKYDIERANKLLDIELQRIALEEAQASKTQMRLRRDSQGNYTYQYVSDQDKVREAQEALEQAQNELYNMDKDAYKNNLDEIQSAYQEYIDEVNDLNILYADNEEEFYNQLILLNEKYNERIDGLTDQNKTIGFNLQGSTLDMVAKITGADADALQKLSNEEIDKIMAQYIPQWSSGVAEMVAKLANGGFNELSEQLVEQLLKLEDSQKAEMDAAALQGNESLNNIANGADVVKDKINELGAETRDTFNEMDAMLKSLSESALKTEEIANNLKEAAEASAQIANNGNPLIYEKASEVDISSEKLDFSNSDSELEGMNFKQYDNIQSTGSSVDKEWYGNKNSILNGLENRIEKAPSDSLDAKKSILNGVEYSQFLIDKLNTSIEDKINQLEKYISNRQNRNPFVTEDLSKELNQSITINADFPDATNAKEIEDAFNNLINAASQYAYKVKK